MIEHQNGLDDAVKKDSHGNGKDASEKISGYHSSGKAPEDIVGRQIYPVGQDHDGIEKDGAGGHGDPESMVQNKGFNQIIQDGHGKAGKEKRIRQPVPAHIIIPFGQGRPVDAAASQD